MRILFIGPNRIGDSVLASGLLDHLSATLPGARFTLACGAAAAPLFENLPGLELLIPMTKARRSGHWWRLWRQVAGTRWDMVVDLRRSVMPWVLRARERRVAPASSARPVEHAVMTFARTLGLEDMPPAPRIWLDEQDARRAAEQIPAGSPVIGIGPTANWAGKIWRAENFLETVHELTDPSGVAANGDMPGARVAVFGAASERDIAQPLIDGLPPDRVIDLVGAVGLCEAAACLERCALYIGNDSGLMHMAAAIRTPTLGLFGPSVPERYAPWGAHTRWVQTDKDVHEIVAAPDYDHRTTGTQMDTLPVSRVVDAARDLRRSSMEDAA